MDLSLLHEDTGKPDILPESLNLPLRLGLVKNETKKNKKRVQAESEQVTVQACFFFFLH